MIAAVQSSGRGFTDHLHNFVDLVECRRAESDADLEAIYRLRYDAYRREGAIEADRRRLFHDSFDEMDNAWTFGLHIEDRLVSSIRIHVATPEHPDCPAVSVFPDLLADDIDAGHTIIDPTRFVTDQVAALDYPELPYATVRLGFAAVDYFSADVALATVRGEHQAFYKRLFGFRPICMPRAYPTLTKPIILMELRDRTRMMAELAGRYPFLTSTAEERELLFNRDAGVESLPLWRHQHMAEGGDVLSA